MNAAERFDASYDVAPSGCWFWRRPILEGNYPSLRIGSRQVGAHRFAYERFVGPIPSGLTIDHLCRVRHCVNPAHLEVVTVGENVLRGEGITADNARKKACPYCGRRYSIATRKDGRTYRVCKPCHYDRTSNPELQRIRRQRRKERATSTRVS